MNEIEGSQRTPSEELAAARTVCQFAEHRRCPVPFSTLQHSLSPPLLPVWQARQQEKLLSFVLTNNPLF